MGMAASQARFLGLTARKSNTEYEGQQINQQRTTLANQSTNYYNQLLGMTVPVPPSTADYTKTTYTFTDGSLNNSISTMIAKADGKYQISYTSSWTNDFSVVSTGQSIVTRSAKGGPYNVGSKQLRQMETRTDAVINAMSDDDLKAFKGKDEYLNTLSNDQIKKLMKEENEYIEILNKQYGELGHLYSTRKMY